MGEGSANATTGEPWLSTDGPSRVFTAPSMMDSVDSQKGNAKRFSWLGGTSMMDSVDSHKGNKTRCRGGLSKLSKDGRCLSAPLLPAAQSTHTSTWYTGSSTTSGASMHCRSREPHWKPLASSWRDWDSDEFGPLRKNVDDGSAFRGGCIPHWGKGCNMRKKSDLGHELTVAYHRTRRHYMHPHRAEVGDPILPAANVVEKMRSGRGNQFEFWRDLRPPFDIQEVRHLGEEDEVNRHPEGDLHEVTIACPIEYQGERLWNTKSVNGTFDNKVHSVVMVRIPDGYPRQRPLTILNWGKPHLNWSPTDDRDEDGKPLRPVLIDPSKWMPISDELKQRADLTRFARCRDATRRADSKHGLQTKPLQKLLLAPHPPSLIKMANIGLDKNNMSDVDRQAAARRLMEETGETPKKVKVKERKLFTACGGFVRYAG